eukprot:TRINITY_DN2381_c0_g1_i1.p1 TRINITY_DN2381_c0_g1~~TRINITY_DN2381_c0_g1_i1.p1  ORF type:complete len:576 (+),score=112.72 TRINITY_DN2381_c0_g1_i1:135-1862(+)
MQHPSLCVWANNRLINEGQLPTDAHQQSCLWSNTMAPLSAQWRYDDGEDSVTIATLEDLMEACLYASTRWSQVETKSVLHLTAFQTCTLSGTGFPQRWFGKVLQYKQHSLTALSKVDADQIELDLPRVWAAKYFEHAPEKLHEPVRRILVAAANARPEIGYCQEMNLVALAALLMAQRTNEHGACDIDEADAFGTLCGWVDEVLPPAFWASCKGLDSRLPAFAAASTVVEKILVHQQPALAAQLEQLLPVSVFVEQFLPALYVGVLPFETVQMVWQYTIEHGSGTLMLTCAAIIELALTPLLNDSGQVDSKVEADVVYRTVASYANSCYDCHGLHSMCSSIGLPATVLDGWYHQAMVSLLGDEISSPECTPCAVPAGELIQELPEEGFVDVFTPGESLSSSPQLIELRELPSMNEALVALQGLSPSKLKKGVHKACKDGDLQMVSCCLEVASDRVWLANAQRGMGSTPLAIAAKHNYPDILELLLEAHADPNVSNWWGKTPLDYAKTFAQEHLSSEPECVWMLQRAEKKRAVGKMVGALRGSCRRWWLEAPYAVCEIIVEAQCDLLHDSQCGDVD